MWVRSEYANELAVLSAWVAMLVPWAVSTHTHETVGGDIENGIFFLRFPLFELQLRSPGFIEIDGELVPADEIIAEGERFVDAYPGTELAGDVFVTTPPTSLAFYDGALWQASLLWTVAAAAFATAFVFSLVLYFREERVVERLPVAPVRLMGALLGVGALGTAGASVLYYLERDMVGTPIPIGVLVIGALALVLLRTKQIEPTEDAVSESA